MLKEQHDTLQSHYQDLQNKFTNLEANNKELILTNKE